MPAGGGPMGMPAGGGPAADGGQAASNAQANKNLNFVMTCELVNLGQWNVTRRWKIGGTDVPSPFNVGGVIMVVCMTLSFLLNMALDDQDTIEYVIYGAAAILALLQIGGGVYTLMALLREDVIAGFAFVPDTEDVKAEKKDKAKRKKRQ